MTTRCGEGGAMLCAEQTAEAIPTRRKKQNKRRDMSLLQGRRIPSIVKDVSTGCRLSFFLPTRLRRHVRCDLLIPAADLGIWIANGGIPETAVQKSGMVRYAG